MRFALVLFSIVMMFSSCARMPYIQWNTHLSALEKSLSDQERLATGIAQSDLDLYNGVYSATKNKEAKPYLELTPLAKRLGDDYAFVEVKTGEALAKATEFRVLYEDKPIRTIGPEWDDYENLLSQLTKQQEANRVKIERLESVDLTFDSVAMANKMRGVPILDYEVELADLIAELEAKLTSLSDTYDGFKKTITERPDQKASMTQMNRMKQKIRQIEGENLQISNLYSRLNSLRSDVILYEGPFIDPLAEIKLIQEKAHKIRSLLGSLEDMVLNYEK